MFLVPLLLCRAQLRFFGTWKNKSQWGNSHHKSNLLCCLLQHERDKQQTSSNLSAGHTSYWSIMSQILSIYLPIYLSIYLVCHRNWLRRLPLSISVWDIKTNSAEDSLVWAEHKQNTAPRTCNHPPNDLFGFPNGYFVGSNYPVNSKRNREEPFNVQLLFGLFKWKGFVSTQIFGDLSLAKFRRSECFLFFFKKGTSQLKTLICKTRVSISVTEIVTWYNAWEKRHHFYSHGAYQMLEWNSLTMKASCQKLFVPPTVHRAHGALSMLYNSDAVIR